MSKPAQKRQFFQAIKGHKVMVGSLLISSLFTSFVALSLFTEVKVFASSSLISESISVSANQSEKNYTALVKLYQSYYDSDLKKISLDQKSLKKDEELLKNKQDESSRKSAKYSARGNKNARQVKKYEKILHKKSLSEKQNLSYTELLMENRTQASKNKLLVKKSKKTTTEAKQNLALIDAKNKLKEDQAKAVEDQNKLEGAQAKLSSQSKAQTKSSSVKNDENTVQVKSSEQKANNIAESTQPVPTNIDYGSHFSYVSGASINWTKMTDFSVVPSSITLPADFATSVASGQANMSLLASSQASGTRNQLGESLNSSQARLDASSNNNEVLDINNLTSEQQLDLSMYAASIINNLRSQVSKSPLIISQGSLSFANAITAQENADNWSNASNGGHDIAGIGKVAGEYGLNPTGNYYENWGGFNKSISAKNLFTGTDQLGAGTMTLGQMKANIWSNLYRMIFDDLSNGNNYDHINSLLGINGSASTNQYFGLSLGQQNTGSVAGISYVLATNSRNYLSNPDIANSHIFNTTIVE